MSAIKGTNVASPIRPFDTSDTFPVAVSTEIKGGHYQFDTVAEMYAIPPERRVMGMQCYVVTEAKNYTLIVDDGVSATTDNTNWQETPVSADAVSLSDGTTIADKVKELQPKADEKYFVFVLQPVKKDTYPIELPVLFDGEITAVSANTDNDLTLTGDLTVDIELLDSGTWTKYTDVTIAAGTAGNNGTASIVNPIPVTKGSKVRCTVSALDDADKPKSLQVVVTIART